MKILFELLRVQQWVKNLFIFFPLIFSGRLFYFHKLFDCLLTFAGFCLISSSVYIINDIIDASADRHHPRKSRRPLASGEIPKNFAVFLSFLTMGGGLALCARADIFIFNLALGYIGLHLLYNLYTKRVVILDVISIAMGFQIRVWAGSLAAAVLPSVWLQMCVFLLSLFLGFTKRRYEISSLKEKAAEHRNVLAHYRIYLLDQIIIICSTLTIVFYGLYTMSSEIVNRLGSHNLVYSLTFVIYGIFRYLYLIHVKKLGDDPGEVIFSDIPMTATIALWVFYILVVFYSSFILR